MILTTFVCLSATLSTYAKPKEEGKIDKVKYEITYRTKSIIDTTKVDSLGNFIYSEEDMRLEVGEQASRRLLRVTCWMSCPSMRIRPPVTS